jgi:hypothetical protein
MTHHNQTKEQTTWFLISAFSSIVIIVSSPLFGFEFLTARPLNPSLLTFSEYSQRAPSWFLLLPVVEPVGAPHQTLCQSDTHYHLC